MSRPVRDGKDPLACYDCGKHCGMYMVKGSVWRKAFPDYDEVKESFLALYPGTDNRSLAMQHIELCIACLYARLPWTFRIEDFADVPGNDAVRAAYRAGLEKGTTE